MSFGDDGTRSLHDLPAGEADAIRDDYYDAVHGACLVCGAATCAASRTCGCGEPAAIPLDARGLDVACSEACQAAFERESV